MADLKKYQDEKGRVFSMTEEHAQKVGFALVEDEAAEESDDVETKAQDEAEDKSVKGPASKKTATKAKK